MSDTPTLFEIPVVVDESVPEGTIALVDVDASRVEALAGWLVGFAIGAKYGRVEKIPKRTMDAARAAARDSINRIREADG